MKFWQKAFIGILVLFIVSINICLYLIGKYSFSLNMKIDKERALGEYHFIIKGVNETLNSLYYQNQADPTAASVQSLMRSYADYYTKQNIYLKLMNSDKILFSNIPSSAKDNMKVEDLNNNDYRIQVMNKGGINYLYINGKLSTETGSYTLVYVIDLTELYNQKAQLNHYLISVSTVVEIILALILLLLLRKLTYPIRAMQNITNKIAGGVYDERISLPGKDEFHDLAENFNQMASSIQEKIAELDKTAQDKQRLVDNLAHELRTPLTAIRGFAEYLQNPNSRENDRIKATGYILSETDRMQKLAFKLLDLALVRNSTLDLQKIMTIDLFNDVNVVLEPKLKQKNIKLDMDDSLKEIIGDAILLQSMLVNLIDNAVKASLNDSRIQLLAYFDTMPILEVRDFGCGMEEDQTTLVCEPFYRVDKARSRSSGGMGLGLSLCREIAHLHGAEIRINSKIGEGTKVVVCFTTLLQPAENFIMPPNV
jgi:signal transduction histidine kinase